MTKGKPQPKRPRGRPRTDPTTAYRSVFFAKDPETEQIIAAIAEHLRQQGVPGINGNQAISWALHQAAKAHGLGPYATTDMGQGDKDWPWCDACRSYHHPDNPTCKAKRKAR